MGKGRNLFNCGEINIFVYFVVAMFGVGSWVAVNGLWVELPVMVPYLPEGWKLPSYLTVIIQLANVGPILVTFAYTCSKDSLNEKAIVYLILTVGAVACLLLAFFWRATSYIAGEEHSTALLVLQFFLACVDCTSSVLFLPFMSLFRVEYMTGYFIGEGLSGLIPSLVALGQGVGKMTCQNISIVNETTNISHYEIQPFYHEPTFPVEDFFFFLFAMMIMSGSAFTLLNYLPYCKKEHTVEYVMEDNTESSSLGSNSNSHYELSSDQGTFQGDSYHDPSTAGHSNSELVLSNKKRPSLAICTDTHSVSARESLSKRTYIYYLILIAWISAISNGVLPSIQTYSCLPYGNSAYHLAVTLSSISNPVACFVAFLLPVATTIVINGLTLIGTCLAAFILVTAVQSPTPLLYDSEAGPAVVIIAWVTFTALISYSKVSIATFFRKEGKQALLWCGALTQVGSVIGALLTYLLVNVWTIFESAPACP
ncbi:solute carrier family 52, riboflavin transporter, member 3-B-like [Pecten maximus]|uniref:solute carrier family 52, riboflavin transporter, member 3-B-like n=1 Tax=Pecten maximus TaxID=6579 RepID=UPI0014584D42|nr:solute carrier family 52, riboflavin transporter, member 3-B-like [Pecten maximus]XP_033754574.1 solute carrier family 52, riboflavin transporter, member 3-B-like [Pecten maximus]